MEDIYEVLIVLQPQAGLGIEANFGVGREILFFPRHIEKFPL